MGPTWSMSAFHHTLISVAPAILVSIASHPRGLKMSVWSLGRRDGSAGPIALPGRFVPKGIFARTRQL